MLTRLVEFMALPHACWLMCDVNLQSRKNADISTTKMNHWRVFLKINSSSSASGIMHMYYGWSHNIHTDTILRHIFLHSIRSIVYMSRYGWPGIGSPEDILIHVTPVMGVGAMWPKFWIKGSVWRTNILIMIRMLLLWRKECYLKCIGSKQVSIV